VRYTTLGRTGLRVSDLCLGAMMFGAWGNTDHDDCCAIIDAAIDAGVNFIDTANVYSVGESEEIVGKALKGKRDEIVLATKFHAPMGSGQNDRGNSRRHIFQAVEASLRRLDTEWIDLYQVHRWDPDTDHAETLGALTDLVRQGKVRYIGSSTFPGSAIVEAQWTSEHNNLERYVCEQPPYSIFVRGIEAEVLPVLQRYGIGAIVWSPLAGGWLTGKYRKNRPVPEGSRGAAPMVRERFDYSLPENQRKLDLIEDLLPLADAEGVTPTQLAIAWTLQHPGVTSAIIGPKTRAQLDEQLPSSGRTVSSETLDRIDRIVPPGTNVNPADAGWTPPGIADATRRRR
jgi:aryl-alcohol dehydrogenase-like predicted oxidoreductase